MARLSGKVALISGGAGGIGGATAALMVKEGAKVVIADLAKNGPEIAKGAGADFVSLDVTSESQWERAVAETVANYGGIHILVNAAGIEGDQKNNSLMTTSLEEWRRVHAVNLDGTFLGCQKVMPVMERQKQGSIINISSIVSFFPMPFNCAYGSSKAAVQHLTKSVAAWGSRNGNQIRCNSVHPGLIRTRMLLNIVAQRSPTPNDDGNAAAERLAKATLPLGALGAPDDVAQQILYLASDESSQVTGSEFRVDGGWSLNLGGMLGPR
jgi:3(or 17)beta-hydroxysteroid dehydrogenase